MRADKRRFSQYPPSSAAVLRREALRVLCAYALYLACDLSGLRAPLHRAYTALVMEAGSVVLPWIQHFPAVATLENLDIRNLDVPVILLGCLFVVSLRIPLAARAARFALAFAVLFAGSVAGTLAWSQVMAAEDLQSSAGLLLYLPWEFRVLDGLKYLLYDFGMEVSTFVLLSLTVIWNAPELAAHFPAFAADKRARPSPRLRPGRSRAGVVAVGAAVLAFALVLGWTRARESNPLHCHAHARFGDLFLQAGNKAQAEAQYRAAVTGGTTEGNAWLQLAQLLRQRGAHSEAERILRRGVGVVSEGTDRRRLEAALSPGLQNP